MPLSQSKKNRIAWIIKSECDCPDFINYYDIKDALSDSSCHEIRNHFKNQLNIDKVLTNKNTSQELFGILEKLDSLKIDERRRIALIHGLITFPSVQRILDKKDFIKKLQEITYLEERYELQYIFINAVIIALSESMSDEMLNARKNLKVLSDTHENGWEEEALYAQFIRLMENTETLTKTSDNSVSIGKIALPNKKSALMLLLDFTNYDFQDHEFVGGYYEIGRTNIMPLNKRRILNSLEELRGLSFEDSLKYLD